MLHVWDYPDTVAPEAGSTGVYKNVTLRPRTRDGIPTWMLLGPDGQPVFAFDAFAHSLRKAPKNTRNAYCRHLAEFFDYLIEVSMHLANDLHFTKLDLTEAIEAYSDYLRMGTEAGSAIARAVAARRPPGKNSESSLIPKKAAVRKFLRLSEDVRKELAEISRTESRSTLAVDDVPLLPCMNLRKDIEPYQVRAMQINSMLAGVISAGPKLIDSLVLDDGRSSVTHEAHRAFPYDKVKELVDAAPKYLDKTLYSLLAACGCRTHEALQILIEDIDVANGTVTLVDPVRRIGHPSYRSLTPQNRAALSWKSRTTPNTLLIEPFASMFFESLQKYLEHEHIPHGRHSFLFQYRSGANRGMPYFLSAPSTRLERFQKICRDIGVELPRGTGPHALRHMYGTYLLNYFPRANGEYGLPAPIVQQIMGHAQIKNTLKYAKFDNDLLKLEISNANQVLYRSGVPKDLLTLKLEALNSQIVKLRTQLKLEKKTNG